ncbi:hypothetical protein O1M63_47375 [Streptomyces mirabilis]|nr:hypothetical protein [Streptomyces mirabilis]
MPAVLAVWGLGMVVGNLAGGYLADRFPDSAPFVILAVFAAFLAVFAVVSTSPVGAVVGVFTIGTSFAIVPCLQSRLMDVAADARTLAAAGNHAAGNPATHSAPGSAVSRSTSAAAGHPPPGSASPWLRPVCCSLSPHGPNGGIRPEASKQARRLAQGATKSAGTAGMPPRGPYRTLAGLDGSARDLTETRPPCRPRTNGKVERLNRSLLDEWAYARRHIHLGHPRCPDVSRTAAR